MSDLPIIVNDKYVSHFGLKFYDASDILPLKMMKEKKLQNMNILPMMDAEDNTVTYPTTIKHYKFSILEKHTGTDEDLIYGVCLMALNSVGTPKEMFMGQCCCEKQGMLSWNNNEHNTCIRIWSTKKFGKNLFYEVTVCSYKDGVKKSCTKNQ